MSSDRDVSGIVRSWLEMGATVLPDRVLDEVLDRLPATPQRRAWRPTWRPKTMSNAFKIMTAAAVLAAAMFGLGIPFLRSIQGPAAPASPTSSPLPYSWPGSLQAGTYSTRFAWNAPVRFTFTIPEGWQGRDVEVIKDPASRASEVGGSRGISVMFSLVGNVFTDPCGHVLSDPPIGSSVADLAMGLSNLPGTYSRPPKPAALAGYQGEYLEFTVREDIGCAPGSFYMWQQPVGAVLPGVPTGSGTFFSERPMHRIWVLDVEGFRYLIDAMSAADATEADLAELQAVVDSIHIDVTDDTASIGDCTLELTDPGTGHILEQPYTVTMGPMAFELRGPYPVDENDEPLTPKPPLAQVDFTGGDGDRWGGAGLKGPSEGFQTHTGVNGFQGSFVLDAPGTWIATIDGVGCFRQFSIEVLSPAG